MLMIFQQMCGINPLLFFGQRLFKKSGISFLIIPLYVTHLLSTVIMCFIVDKFGRRKLLMLGALGMLLCNSLLGVYLQLFIIPNYNEYYKNINLFDEDIRVLEPFNVKYDPKYSLLAFLCFFLFILCYSIGWGPLPYLFMSELFPPRLRGLSCSTVLIVNWVFSLIATASFFIPPLEVDIVTWIFCVFCLISIFFVYFFVPETKDKTLEEIEHYYQMNQQWLNYLF
ncbi:facilitated trehalose transporter Tret1-like [Hydra vulgaris]|uniref:Facilitated trehalose transporter Tret1-like n=1 Tax=Hydra vulgaris TaxID=6087 RepID=A0ABM4BP28_HYDVU